MKSIENNSKKYETLINKLKYVSENKGNLSLSRFLL